MGRMGKITLPFWAWFTLARRIHAGQLYRSNRKGARRKDLPPYRFGDRITLPQTYWDGGVWAVPSDPISTGDPGGARSRLYVWLQSRGYDRSKPLFVSQHYFPRGSGLKWRYEVLRGRYGLSPHDARLVISIEDGKDYSENALKVAKHREQQMIEEILSRPPGECQGMPWKEYKALKEMFPKAQTIRIPRTLNSIWPPELVTFFKKRNLLGKTFSIPSLDSYSYVSTPAETVLVRGFANNLDRAALLCVLMREAGLEADLVLIRNRSSGQLVPSFPTLGQLNTALVLFEDRIYLDPNSNVGFGTLSDQDAMGLSLFSGKLKKTPLRTPNEEATITRTVAQLRADGSLDLTVDVEFNGQNSAWWKRYLKALSLAELRQEAEELASYIHPNARLQDFSFHGIEPLDQDVSYTLKVRITDYATRAGDYLILYLPGVEHSAYWVGARDRAYPIDRVTRSADILNLSLQLPPGAELIYYPQDVSISNPYDSYAAAFVQPRRGVLQFSESLQVLKPWIPPQEYPKYKELVEGMARLSQEPIVLKLH